MVICIMESMNPTLIKAMEIYRSSGHYNYFPETTMFGKKLYENIGKTIRYRLCRLITRNYMGNPHFTICVSKHFLDVLNNEWNELRYSNSIRSELEEFKAYLNSQIKSFEETNGNVEVRPYVDLLFVANVSSQEFLYGWNYGAWGAVSILYYPRDRNKAKLAEYANTYL